MAGTGAGSIRGRARSGRRSIAVAAGAVLSLLPLLGLAACAGVHWGDGERCLPSAMTAAPRRVAAGEAVRISAPAFTCSARYGAGKVYRLRLLAGRADPEPLGSVPVARDGSFAVSVVIPAGAPQGDAYVEALGSAFDDCKDTVGSGSCAGYSVAVTVLPGS